MEGKVKYIHSGNPQAQFSIEIGTKNRLDRFKVQHKEEIISKYKMKKRLVTNSKVIDFLLDTAGARK